jgi:hypothetical protein
MIVFYYTLALTSVLSYSIGSLLSSNNVRRIYNEYSNA